MMDVVTDTDMKRPEPIPFDMEGPQPLLREIPAGEPYPVEALGPLQETVESVQGMTLAPIAIPAASALSVASLAVQGFCDVETLNGTRPLSLFALTIAQSGERKSSCDAPLMAELRKFEKEQAEQYRQERTAYENDYAIWKAGRDRILNEAKSAKEDKRAGAGDALAALGKEPTLPPSPDRTVTEPTFEGLTRKLAEGMPTLGIFSDEGGQFLGGFAMASENRQKTLAALNDLWQGNPIRRTRQGDGSMTLFGKRLAVHLMVQPSVARAFMADPMAADTGFLPRFLICEPPSTIGTRFQSRVRHDRIPLARYSARMRSILETPLPMDAETRELEPQTLAMSDDARALLGQFADYVEREQSPGREYANITGYASKAAEQAARIAGVMTAWEDLNAIEVTGPTMANAITLAGFYLSEAKRLSDAAIVSEKVERAERLRTWLLDTWMDAEILPSDILRSGPSRMRESPAAKEAISILEKHGWLVRLPEGSKVRGKIRKEAYRIVRYRNEI